MKVLNSLALASVACLAISSTCVSAAKGFTAPKPSKGSGSGSGHGNGPAKKYIKTAANFDKGGAKIELCPSGDCVKGQLITLSMSRLEEVEAGANSTTKPAQKAENFNAIDAEWTDFEETYLGDAEGMSTSYVTDVIVGPRGNPAGTAKFNLTATIVSANATAKNGDQSVPVPAGALKFTISLANWPFKSTNNSVRFAVTLSARGKSGKSAKDKPTKKARGDSGDLQKIDRVDMGEGMFMDAPALAVLDGASKDITATVESSNNAVEYVWVFPYFNRTLYYDPVVGSEDPSAQPVTSDEFDDVGTTPQPTSPPVAPTPTPAPTKSGAATAWTSVASATLAGVVALVASAVM
ncbi:hypothetical protein PINS_up011009 [Pythium insidiosum]|nr:hypothetical protein PINS_up011003 [Pythium insidiosum]GLE02166.1 hypothetical protein PINS_up011004 [Pythium insidiosum]GLE02167.1 hypothetical protein PINS_up011005 [Pythium insidiosum]GLE02169.1 hypothetical protein PINS_up011007 [Pythium insidiosum]GLE02170.1 hypothetical protein PINS_up011008 [Pythium insidiosum]